MAESPRNVSVLEHASPRWASRKSSRFLRLIRQARHSRPAIKTDPESFRNRAPPLIAQFRQEGILRALSLPSLWRGSLVPGFPPKGGRPGTTPCVPMFRSLSNSMFSKIARAIEETAHELRLLNDTLKTALEELQTLPPGSADLERLAALEGRIEAVFGIVEAGLIEMKARKAAAAASEARERGHLKRAEAALELAQELEGGEEGDSFEAAGRAYAGVVSPGDDGAEPEQGVLPLPDGVEGRVSGLAAVRAAKHGA